MKYRPEIDGLRALAVIPVILFHAGFEHFSGGYVGVDVFFVISGYLITTIILSEIEAGTFSLVSFYERRARRILPALFLVMVVSLPAAWLWLSPPDMEDFSKSLVAVSIFSSNFLFWLESGYWDAASELKPLLHTWSLAVEEQYYLLFPLFLMMMWRFRKRWIVGSFMLIAAASLVVAQWGAYHYPAATFFLLPTRAWELAIGASIAFYFLYRKNAIRILLSHKIVDDVLGLCGLLMIGYATLAFDETVPFPSLHALIPTIGTGLIILFSSPQTLVGRLLGTRLLVGIGLISYSAYLWHYPLISFARHRSLTEPGEWLFAFLALLSFPLAYLSWKYVEGPFRKKGVYNRKTIFLFTFVGSAFFIAIGLAGLVTNGWQARVDERLVGLSTETNEVMQCTAKKFQQENICELVDSRTKLTFLMGDSHAGAIAYEMQKAFSEEGVGLLLAKKNRCPPIQNVYRADRRFMTDLSCYENSEEIYRFIRNNKDIEFVVLLARWTLTLEGTRFNNKEGGVETSKNKPHLDLVVDGQPEYHPNYDHRPGLAKRYSDSIQALLDMGKKVILVYPVPETGWDVPTYLSRYYMINPTREFRSEVGSTSHEVFKERNSRSYDALDKVGTHPGLYRIYPENILCDNDVKDRCIVQKQGHTLYRDDDHLSNAGAKLIVEQIIGLID